MNGATTNGGKIRPAERPEQPAEMDGWIVPLRTGQAFAGCTTQTGARDRVKRYPNLTLADANAHMKALGQDAYAPLMADEAHPNPEGQKVMAGIFFRAITGEAPAPAHP